MKHTQNRSKAAKSLKPGFDPMRNVSNENGSSQNDQFFRVALDVIDKDSGIMVGVKRLDPTTMDMLMNYSARLSASVSVRKVSNGVQVSINSINERKHEEHDWRPAGPADAYSTGLFEVINRQLTQAGNAQVPAPPTNESQPAPASQVTPVDSGRETLREAQKILNSLGFNAGPEDGLMGSRTSNALLAFQEQSGIQATGKLNDQTMEKLREAARTGANSNQGLPSSQPQSPTSTKSSGDSSRTSEESSLQPIARGTVTVPTDLKAAADPFSDSLTALPSGARVEILKMEGDWLQVRFSGREGYVLSSFVSQWFIRARNELVHEGRFVSQRANVPKDWPFTEPIDEYFHMLRFADRLVLRTLGYRGAFLDRSSRGTRRVAAEPEC